MPQSFQVGAKCIVIKENTVLLLKFPREAGHVEWDFPGGRIDGEETISQAIDRELKEELPGIKAYRVGDLVYAERAPGNFKSGIGLLWLFYRIETTLNTVNLSEEHIGYEWIHLSTLADLNRRTDIQLPAAFYRALTLVAASNT